ncbi:MAG: hypothetical protein WAT78_08740, partial [Rhizobiaceae bacterium]
APAIDAGVAAPIEQLKAAAGTMTAEAKTAAVEQIKVAAEAAAKAAGADAAAVTAAVDAAVAAAKAALGM